MVTFGLDQGADKSLAARFSAAQDLWVMRAWRACQPDWSGMAMRRWSLLWAMRRRALVTCLAPGVAPKNPEVIQGVLGRPASLGGEVSEGRGRCKLSGFDVLRSFLWRGSRGCQHALA